jgi:hypothetical protein
VSSGEFAESMRFNEKEVQWHRACSKFGRKMHEADGGMQLIVKHEENLQ